jgi:hypothetical protein
MQRGPCCRPLRRIQRILMHFQLEFRQASSFGADGYLTLLQELAKSNAAPFFWTMKPNINTDLNKMLLTTPPRHPRLACISIIIIVPHDSATTSAPGLHLSGPIAVLRSAQFIFLLEGATDTRRLSRAAAMEPSQYLV